MWPWLFPQTGDELLDTVRSIPGWLAQNEIIALNHFAKEAIIKSNKSDYLVEIGSFLGKSTVAIALACKRLNKCKVLSVDPHKNSDTHRYMKIKNSFNGLKKNLTYYKLSNYVIIEKTTSQKAYPKYVNINTNLLFLDGDHRYKQVSKDFSMWSNVLDYGGYLILHDAFNIKGPRMLMFNLLLHKNYSYVGHTADLACFKKRKTLSIRNWIKKLYGYLIIKALFIRIYKPAVS